MAGTIAGILGIEDSERTFVEGVGQEAIFDAITQLNDQLNLDLFRLTNLFIEQQTDKYKFRYYLPGNDELQQGGGLGNFAERKTGGSWDVELPILEFGDALGGDYVDLAYMTIADLDRQYNDIAMRAQRTLRKQILMALLDNVNWTYEDRRKGSLTIRGLANQDGTLFAPLPGSDDAAQENYYLETGYAVSAIDEATNPIKTASQELQDRWSGLSNDRVVLISRDMKDKVKALDDFEEVDDPRIRKGITANQLIGAPENIPGEIIGRINEAWVSVWAWLPATYGIGIALGVEKPLRMRVDPAYTNLPSALRLVKNSDMHPLSKSEWKWRFGIGAANRLNGFVFEVANGGTYTVPTGYSHS